MANPVPEATLGSIENKEALHVESVVERFEQQVALRPLAPAVTSDTGVLTYSELNLKANQLAQSLREQGIGPDCVVGLLAGRNASFVVGCLAILKAGGAYLPLDPAFPLKHLASVFSDAGASVLVTETSFKESAAFSAQAVVFLDAENGIFLNEPTTANVEDNLAYVIYTSGSSGKPKGVEISRASLAHLVDWHQNVFGVSPSDRVSQFAALSFDAAVWEIWPHLTAGAEIRFVPDSVRSHPDLLRDWIVENRITISFVPTAIAESLIELSWPSNTALRILLTGADTLHRFPRSGLPFQLVNNYGPTECTVVATSGIVPADGERAKSLPTIGRPIASTCIFLLDEKLEPVAEGEEGEIFIAGPSLAKGYRNRPDLTAERFINHPLAKGARLYRSGDRGRFLPSGEIAFLGRSDDQIKISGHRIEPNQIVHALESHPGVDIAAVIARDDAQSSKKLVAYVVQKQDSRVHGAELHEYLDQRLPAYMVPVIFVGVDSLPLTPNGKVDRSALPAPDSSNILQDASVTRPMTPIEERLSRILGKLLGVSSVALEDNFFNLGGHSLLATQLIARIRDAFGIDLNLRTIFDTPTIVELAQKIEEAILQKVAAMSEEEAQRLLGIMMPPDSESASL